MALVAHVAKLVADRPITPAQGTLCRDFDHAMQLYLAMNMIDMAQDWDCPAWRVVRIEKHGAFEYHLKPSTAARTNRKLGVQVVC